MKRLLLLLLSALMLTGCSTTEPEILFNETTEGIVSVILEDYNDCTIHYDTIGPNGERQETQPFESDPMEILTAEADCFESDDTAQPPNRLLKCALLDESGNPVAVSETDARIFELAADQENVIQKMRILHLGDHNFVTLEWSVNFWDPHVLYYYNSVADQLVELYTYDATQVIGLKILNLP